MLFVLLSNIVFVFVFTACVNAKPFAFEGNPNVVRVIAIPEEYVAEESHPNGVVVPSPQASAPMEVSDDDSYDETAPRSVIAVPDRARVVRIERRDDDLDEASTDLQPAATGYGGHGGHGGGHDNAGWLDMGAYSSGYGAFGWYADFPVGGGHGYGRR